jgi:hypothetical protein
MSCPSSAVVARQRTGNPARQWGSHDDLSAPRRLIAYEIHLISAPAIKPGRFSTAC